MALTNPTWYNCGYADERLVKFLKECCLMDSSYCHDSMRKKDWSSMIVQVKRSWSCVTPVVTGAAREGKILNPHRWSLKLRDQIERANCEPLKSSVETLFMSLPEFNSTGLTSDNKIIVAHKEIKEQLDCYQRERCTSNGDPLTCWREHASWYPCLANSAKGRLAVCGTLVPYKRVFSAAGNLLTAKQACLSSDNVDRIISFNKNMKMFK